MLDCQTKTMLLDIHFVHTSNNLQNKFHHFLLAVSDNVGTMYNFKLD